MNTHASCIRGIGNESPDSRQPWTLLTLAVAAVASLLTFAAAPVCAAAPATQAAMLVSGGLDRDGQVRLTLNRSAVLTTARPYRRVSVSDPDVAAINPISPSSVLVTAKKAGATQLILWDDAEQAQTVDVSVRLDLQALQDQYAALFPGTRIDLTLANGAIVLRGRVPDLQTAEQAVQVAGPYAQKVLNFLEISGGQQVMLQVRFAEVSRSASNSLGVNFGFTDSRSFFGSNIGQVSPLGIQGTDLAVQTPNPAVTLFGRGVVGETAFAYFIDALRQNNLLRILAEPNLVTMSGQEASFLAGGEFPIPVTQGGGTGAPAITIEYRVFGVKLIFTPLVLGNGRIRLKVAPEVSDLDFTTAVRFNGFVVPGLNQRRVQTTVELAEGQTFAVAGLLNQSMTANKDVTPLLGDIPVLGVLFRSVRYQRKETELVVMVTPRLVAPMNPDQVPLLPGEKWRHPSELDLYFRGDIGGPAEAPALYGQPGFVPATQPAEQAR